MVVRHPAAGSRQQFRYRGPQHRTDDADVRDARDLDLHDRLVEVIVINDAIWSLSIHRHGHITDEMEEQARRARIAYSRTFLPEYLPLRAKDRPA